MTRFGILLAGGAGTRLYPVTRALSKQLLPVYDKPMIYYPLTTLMMAGLRDILVISTPQDTPRFAELLGNGEQWGLNISYAVQQEPKGIAQAFLIAKDHIRDRPSALVLGDNIFYGHDFLQVLERVNADVNGATVFAHHVKDPWRYGVVTFDSQQKAIELEEKPTNPKSPYAVTGLYFYDHLAHAFAASLKPSLRGELEITDLNMRYLKAGALNVQILGRGYAWLDTGTHDSLLEASSFVATLQHRQGLMMACPEEVAFRKGWISGDSVLRMASQLRNTAYGAYLEQVAKVSVL